MLYDIPDNDCMIVPRTERQQKQLQKKKLNNAHINLARSNKNLHTNYPFAFIKDYRTTF